jgi:hypothetical protein
VQLAEKLDDFALTGLGHHPRRPGVLLRILGVGFEAAEGAQGGVERLGLTVAEIGDDATEGFPQ